MFEYEYRSPEQISREAAEHYAHVMAIAERKAEAKRERHQPFTGSGRIFMCAELVEARQLPFDKLRARFRVIQRRRRAVPKMLRTISVPAVRANCLNALESVICSTIDFSRRCELRG